MNYQELMIRNHYVSRGEDSIIKSLIKESMPHTETYRRSVNHISVNHLKTLISSMIALARSHGTMRLLYCPLLSEESIIPEEGEDIFTCIRRLIRSEADDLFAHLQEMELRTLQELINYKYIQIQYCLTKDNGTVYNPVGIMTDRENNSFTYRAELSADSPEQYEVVRVFRSWVQSNLPFVNQEIKDFDSIWNHTHPDLIASDLTNILQNSIDDTLKNLDKAGKEVIKLRDYQKEAIQAWVENSYHGFYVMATGTGKTWTAIYSAKQLMDQENVLTVITAPYKHLIKQWGEDLKRTFPEATIIYISSENPGWEAVLRKEIISLRYNKQRQLIVVSTIASFNMRRFRDAIETHKGKKLLIVDEAHRFTQRNESLQQQYQYMLGLSATPYRGKSAESGKELMNFFGGQVYNLPIEKALEMKRLVPYYYHPIFVYSTEEEETTFAKLTQKITTCFNAQGNCINPDALVTYLRARLRVIAMAEGKFSKLEEFLREHDHLSHFVVYCGDGRVYEENSEKRHIQIVKEMLDRHGYATAQFTAQESMNERMELISSFDKGIFSALAAIRCLDEGINIPSIESAMILASNDDYREFVQRRGRILRTYGNKDHADIYDLVVLPSGNAPGIAVIELRRYAEYAKLAKNWPQLEPELEKLMSTYGLTSEQINVFEFEEERDIDE